MQSRTTTLFSAATRRPYLGFCILVALLTFEPIAPAQASIELVFGASSTSSNSPPTGASAKIVMTFVDTMSPGQVSLELLISNTTGSPAFGSGATASKLTGFGMDLPSGFTLLAGSLTTDIDGDSKAYFDTLIVNAALPPFGTLDFGVADNNNFLGGNANGALPAGLSDKVSVKLGGGSAATAEAAFLAAFTDPDDASYKLNSVVRFQQVNAGAGSDKLANPTVTTDSPPPPPDASAPEPTSLLVWAMSAVCGVGSVRCRQLA